MRSTIGQERLQYGSNKCKWARPWKKNRFFLYPVPLKKHKGRWKIAARETVHGLRTKQTAFSFGETLTTADPCWVEAVWRQLHGEWKRAGCIIREMHRLNAFLQIACSFEEAERNKFYDSVVPIIWEETVGSEQKTRSVHDVVYKPQQLHTAIIFSHRLVSYSPLFLSSSFLLKWNEIPSQGHLLCVLGQTDLSLTSPSNGPLVRHHIIVKCLLPCSILKDDFDSRRE